MRFWNIRAFPPSDSSIRPVDWRFKWTIFAIMGSLSHFESNGGASSERQLQSPHRPKRASAAGYILGFRPVPEQDDRGSTSSASQTRTNEKGPPGLCPGGPVERRSVDRLPRRLAYFNDW
jgi:hypothetical protein